MIRKWIFYLALIFAAAAPWSALWAQRLAGRLDGRSKATLRGSRNPRIDASVTDGGGGHERGQRHYVSLWPSDAQLAELEQLLEVQQNPSSPKHHAWLTPEEYGDRFGLSRVVFLRSPELCDVSDPHARSKWRLTMTNFLRCASLICAPGWAAFAQTTEPVRSPQIVWPKAAVTVVFAPDLGQATRRSGASRADALESWLHKAMVDGPAKDAPKPVQFAGPGGATGIRLGPEAMTATAVIVDEDGNRHSTCASLPDAVERLRSTSRRQRKEIVSEK